MQQVCTKCKEEKSTEEFRWQNKAKGKRAKWCKPCFSLHEKQLWLNSPTRRNSNCRHNKQRRYRNAQVVWDYLKTHPCITCGEPDPVVLDFDHRDPSEKRRDLSTMSRASYSVESLMEEISKCDVLCSNCHRRRTAEQFGWFANIER